jgi:5-methylcytosine-specific restriction endonuclease McrA
MAQIWWVDENGAEERPPRANWQKRLRRGHSRCQWCGRNVFPRAGRFSPTIDHIVPVSQGGKNIRENAKVSCIWCNEGRAAVGHCIVTLTCINAIVGSSLSKIAVFYNRSCRGD